MKLFWGLLHTSISQLIRITNTCWFSFRAATKFISATVAVIKIDKNRFKERRRRGERVGRQREMKGQRKRGRKERRGGRGEEL